MKDEAFDELEKAQQRKIATGVTDGSKVTIDRAKLEQVLEALESLFGLPDKFTGGGGDVAVWRLGGSYRAQEAIKTLKEALEDV
jgi:hypothetical protein